MDDGQEEAVKETAERTGSWWTAGPLLVLFGLGGLVLGIIASWFVGVITAIVLD